MFIMEKMRESGPMGETEAIQMMNDIIAEVHDVSQGSDESSNGDKMDSMLFQD